MSKIIEYYKDEVQEHAKCKEDITYFAEKYIKIDGQDFVPYSYQYEVLRHGKLVADTARQIGFSTIAKIRIVHSLIFNYGRTIAICSYNLSSSRHDLQDIIRMFEQCTYKYKPEIDSVTKSDLRMDNNMRVLTANLSSTYFRGLTLNELYCSELAHCSRYDIDSFMIAIYPTINIQKNPIIWFYGLDTSSKVGVPSGFEYIRLPYYVVPNSGRLWVQQTEKMISKEQFDKEFLMNF